jgi:hypothetical protein
MKEEQETSAGGLSCRPRPSTPTGVGDPFHLRSPSYQRVNSRPCFRPPFPGPRPAEFNLPVRPRPGSSFLLARAGNRGFPN